MRGLFLFRNLLLEWAGWHGTLGNLEYGFQRIAEPRERFLPFDHVCRASLHGTILHGRWRAVVELFLKTNTGSLDDRRKPTAMPLPFCKLRSPE